MGTFEIPKGHKYAALAVHRAGRKSDLPERIDVHSDMSILASPPLKLPDRWKKWVGSIRSDEIGDANLWCVSILPSTSLEVLDDKNARLSSRVQHYFLALLLVGSLFYETAYFMTGSNLKGTPQVRQFGDLGHYFPSYGRSGFIVSPEDLSSAAKILEDLLLIYGEADFLRVRRGIRVFWKGLQEREPEDRLHQFVRSLDAIVVSSNADEFGERAQVFAFGDNVETALKDSYTLRSVSEHLHGWERVIERLFNQPPDGKVESEPPAAEEQALRSVRLLEELTRDVYRQIILIPEQRALFRDNGIRQFWKFPPEERQRLWPKPLDVASVK